MFKLVLLSVLVAAASAGVVAPLAYTAHYATPTAHSYQSRTDVHSKPVLATYAAAPAAYVAAYAAAPTAHSYQSRTDVHSKPVVAAPVYAPYAAPAVYTAYATPEYTYGAYDYGYNAF